MCFSLLSHALSGVCVYGLHCFVCTGWDPVLSGGRGVGPLEIGSCSLRLYG